VHHELPAQLDLEWYRKQAKELVRAWRERDPEAVERVEEALGERADERFRLSDAQWVIASEHGYRSWAEFRRWVETREPEPPVGRIGRRPVAWYEERARSLMLAKGTSLRQEKLTVAHEYGFPTWRDLAHHVGKAIREHEERPGGELGRAYELMRAGDFEAFRAVLDERPELVHQHYRGAAATLLEALTQPDNHHVDLRFAELLVERGSELAEPLGLAACFNHVPLVRLLLDAGARQTPSRIWGITPLQAAVYHGSKEAGDLLELTPDAYYLAAGAGRTDRLERGFDETHELRPNLTDVGWPPFEPEPGAQAILDEAFALAAYNGRLEAMAFLLERGASVHGRAHGTTALRFAAMARRRDVLDWLVEGGAAAGIGEAFEAASATWGERGEAVLDSGLTYGGAREPVLVSATKREGRYLFSDKGRAAELAGRPTRWREAARRLEDEYAVNVSRTGVVSLPAVQRRDSDWLTTVVERIAEASAAFYAELLELDEPLHSDV
jgi:Ankyrin repeats (many copies)